MKLTLLWNLNNNVIFVVLFKLTIMKFIFLLCFIIFGTISCSKFKDTEKPIITILSPRSNDTITGSNTEVFLNFSASDNEKLSSLLLEISDTNGNTYFTDTKTLSGLNYSYKNSFLVLKNTKIKALVMKVRILDVSGNENIALSSFYLAP